MHSLTKPPPPRRVLNEPRHPRRVPVNVGRDEVGDAHAAVKPGGEGGRGLEVGECDDEATDGEGLCGGGAAAEGNGVEEGDGMFAEEEEVVVGEAPDEDDLRTRTCDPLDESLDGRGWDGAFESLQELGAPGLLPWVGGEEVIDDDDGAFGGPPKDRFEKHVEGRVELCGRIERQRQTGE